MQLIKVKVRGFRSLKSVDLDLEEYTCLIGRNDAGKSSLLRAIHLLLDPGTSFQPDDVSKFNLAEDTCFIEGAFSGLDGRCPYLQDGVWTLRRTFGPGGSRFEYLGQTPKHPILKRMLAGSLTKRDFEAATLPRPVLTAIGALPPGQLRPQDWISAYMRAHAAGCVEKEAGYCPLQPEEIGQYVQVVFLPADVRAEDEASGSSKSVFGKIGAFLLRGITSSDPDLARAVQLIRTRMDELTAKNPDGSWKLDAINQMKMVLDEGHF